MNPEASWSRGSPATDLPRELHQRAYNSGTLMIGAEINSDSFYTVFWQAQEMIEARSREASPNPIRVIINSPGGDAFLGLAVAKMLAASPVPIHTVVAGVAASASALIFLGGHRREVLPGSRVMLHAASSWRFAATSEHARRLGDLHEGLDKEIIEFICERTGMLKSFVARELLADHWYSDTFQAHSNGIANYTPGGQTAQGSTTGSSESPASAPARPRSKRDR